MACAIDFGNAERVPIGLNGDPVDPAHGGPCRPNVLHSISRDCWIAGRARITDGRPGRRRSRIATNLTYAHSQETA